MQETNTHFLKIDKQKEVEVGGALSVIAFSESKITLEIVGGRRLYIVGNGLKNNGFSASVGSFNATGEIKGISYGGKSFAARLFK